MLDFSVERVTHFPDMLELPVRERPLVRLHPELVKQIKVRASERGCSDNRVLETAVRLGLAVLDEMQSMAEP